MNTQTAKQIDLLAFLSTLGHEPVKTVNGQYWYKSPLRNPIEKIPSFVVEPEKNIWIDFGLGETGGSIIDLVMELHGYSTVTQALEYLNDYQGLLPITPIAPKTNTNLFDQTKNTIQIRKVFPLKHHVLLKYLSEKRGISAPVGQQYLKCVFYDNGGRSNLYALGWAMDSGGYELRSALFKACSARKDVTTITMTAAPYLYIFEGMMDFLSALEYRNRPSFPGTALILNTTALISRAIELIKSKEWTQVFTFFDNDESGKKASQRLVKDCPDTSIKVIDFYDGFKDVNDFWCAERVKRKEC